MTRATSKAEARRRGRNSAKATITLVDGVGGTHTRTGRKVDHTATVKAQRRKQGVSEASLLDQRNGWALGKACLAGELYPGKQNGAEMNTWLYDAGCHYAKIQDAYRRAKGLPSPNLAAQNIDRQGRTLAPEADPDEVAKWQALNTAAERILSNAGQGVLIETQRVCAHEDDIRDMARLQIGLRALAEWKDGQ